MCSKPVVEVEAKKFTSLNGDFGPGVGRAVIGGLVTVAAQHSPDPDNVVTVQPDEVESR